MIPNSFSLRTKVTKDKLIKDIVAFVDTHGKISSSRDFLLASNYDTYNSKTYRKYFGSWNNAILEAGFKPNLQNGFGIDTKALDGHLYRSALEADFCNKFLFGLYNYIIEPRYPNPYNKYYDWYIPSLDLYIELDGGCRPLVLKEKLLINNKLNRKLLVVTASDVYDTNYKIERN